MAFKLSNYINGKQTADTLHKNSQKLECGGQYCVGSMMSGQTKLRMPSAPREKDEVLIDAKDFLEQYYKSQKGFTTEDFLGRLVQVEAEVQATGTYEMTRDELHYGARMAWRNAARCIGRIQWNKLELQDARHITSTKEMYEALLRHLEYGTNEGNLRSMITVFPSRVAGREDFRVWSPQLVSYAGYLQADGSVIGDPTKVQLTRVCQRLGWKGGKGGKFDLLPWVFSAPGETVTVYDIPEELVLRVKLEHPKYSWFKDMELEWYAVPAVADMLFDCGGVEFPAAPFNGWYMGTEIGARDLCDPQRYNITNEVAEKLGLDTSTPITLWKDQVLIEVNVAVLYSFQKNKVTIVDHHTASESFMKHMETEQKLRGGCPADWVWIVPPMSGSLTPVYHQEMLSYSLKPSYEYQEKAWKTYRWSKSTNIKLKYHLSTVAKATFWATSMMNLVRHKRIRCTILYATETGKSETYAQRLGKLMHSAFNVRSMCMEDYNMDELSNERLVLIVASTFGSGEAPDNGKEFWKSLAKLRESRDLQLNGMKFSVFALGSSQYPTFCQFGKDCDSALSTMEGERLLPVEPGDELRGQEQVFNQWAEEIYKVACKTFSLNVDFDTSLATFEKGDTWDTKNFRVIPIRGTKSHDLYAELSRLHHKKVLPCKVLSRARLQARHSDRQTILVRMDTYGSKELCYIPGDHMGIFPANPPDIVDAILDNLRDSGFIDDVIQVETLSNGKWKPVALLPPCSLETALTRYLDITSPPLPHLLSLLSDMATQNWDKYRLKHLAQNIDEYEDWKNHKYPHLQEVLEEFPSIKLTPEFLMTQLPLLQPRYYSISSSRATTPNEVHLTMSIVNYHTQDGKGPLHQGVATSYFYGFPQEDVPCFVKNAPSFRLPNQKSAMLMVGAGSGIAPFRSFWQQREEEMRLSGDLVETIADEPDGTSDSDSDNENTPYGKMVLLFGCRQSSIDNIFSHETTALLRKGVLQEVITAFSRQPGQKKVYVQDAIVQERALIYKILVKKAGHMYVCGDAVMADGVRTAVKLAIELEGGMAHKEAENIFQKLQGEGRYHEDVFGILHRRDNKEAGWQQNISSYKQENLKSLNVKTRRKSTTDLERRNSIRNNRINPAY